MIYKKNISSIKNLPTVAGEACTSRDNVTRGFTLIELIVSVGLFALVMLLASGAYITMIGINRQVQGLSSGTNNLSFAMESMARSIRTGTQYKCPTSSSNCTIDGNFNNFSFTNEYGQVVSYNLTNSAVQETVDNVQSNLTGSSVIISKLTFYVTGTHPASINDYQQSRITIIVSGTVSYGKGRTKSFTVETGATMRGSDI